MISSPDTPTLRLRALEPEDLELVYRIENDPTFWRHGSTTVPYSRYTLRQFIADSTGDIFRDRQVRLVIEIKEESGARAWKAIGFADLVNFDAIHLRAEIGLLILPEHQGHHHGASAMQALCHYASSLHLHQIYAIIATTNKPATQLFTRLGFEASAPLHDWLRAEDSFVDAVVWQRMLPAATTATV